MLTKLVDRNGDERYEISALVRKPYQASILTDAGVTPILFESLDDFEVIREAARSVDGLFSFLFFLLCFCLVFPLFF